MLEKGRTEQGWEENEIPEDMQRGACIVEEDVVQDAVLVEEIAVEQMVREHNGC